MSVSSWIQKHLGDNPYVDLTPVFNDYRNHLASIESTESPSKQSPDAKPLPSVTPPLSITSKVETKDEQASSKSLYFQTNESVTVNVKNEEKPFAGLAAAALAGKAKEIVTVDAEEEPSDEPPKPKRGSTVLTDPICSSVVTAEVGSKFSVRCKLFFNRNNAWSELGVGMLSIKDIDGKSQLLVRADTATGNILLNIFIASTMPVTRNGKNNVMMVSIPNPPLYSKASEGDNNKPATYLIRVKTAESADELFKMVEDLKSN
ncbi:hypothetical protein QZH41_018940 [Actinostola sp. cb2023]|nr:hypothetical protein QZH41_018940 [Actinostola sp. cb2023]